MLYKHHTIIAGASLAEITREYIPVAYIAWETPSGKRDAHILASSLDRSLSYAAASAVALEAAKKWIDRRLGELD